MNKLINLNNLDYKRHIITPITPYLICDHHFSTEIYPKNKKYIGVNIDEITSKKANDLYLRKNYKEIKNFDIILVQVDLFHVFANSILPLINKKIIVITCQWQLPQLDKDNITDDFLIDDKIILWISQNPIYFNHHKYMSFPFGLDHKRVNDYFKFIKENYLLLDYKENYLYNSPMKIHKHLSDNHIRRNPIFKSVETHLNYKEYLHNILKSKFVISTSGDRHDCYRHYEIIGLNAIPVSNINFVEIFQDNMIYTDINTMEKLINGEEIFNYKLVDKDILTVEYWKNKIKERKNKCLKFREENQIKIPFSIIDNNKIWKKNYSRRIL